jgi:DNA-binding response OmpR family regulator
MQTRIVVGLIEDDPIQAELFTAMILASGMQALAYESVQAFRRRNGAESVDVLLLDWNLPRVSGIDLLQSMQHVSGPRLPVILLTARSDERDLVYGLQAGADDYIIKPPRPAELAARVKVAYRRAHPQMHKSTGWADPFDIDLQNRLVRLNGDALNLTEREFDLLVFMFARSERVVSRDILLAEVWKLPSRTNTRSVDTHVSRLRRKAGLDGTSGWSLSSIYQTGYRLSRGSGQTRVGEESLASGS